MPNYLVRWANLSGCIVSADDEEHLKILLDEVGDPGAALWEEYEGPLWLELHPMVTRDPDTDAVLLDERCWVRKGTGTSAAMDFGSRSNLPTSCAASCSRS